MKANEIQTNICIHIFVYIYFCICFCVYLYIYICIYIFEYVFVYVFIYVFVHTIIFLLFKFFSPLYVCLYNECMCLCSLSLLSSFCDLSKEINWNLRKKEKINFFCFILYNALNFLRFLLLFVINLLYFKSSTKKFILIISKYVFLYKYIN